MAVNKDPRCDDLVFNSLTNETLIQLQSNLNKSALAIYPTQFLVAPWIFVIVSFLHSTISPTIFWYLQYKRSYMRLKYRPFSIVLLTSFTYLLMTFGGMFTYVVWYPCFIIVMINMMLAPLVGVSMLIKILDFFNKSVFSQAINVAYLDHADSIKQPAMKEIRSILLAQNSSGDITMSSDLSPVAAPQLENGEEVATKIMGMQMSERTLKYLKILCSSRARIFLVALFMFPFLTEMIYSVATIDYLNPAANCYGCNLSPSQMLYAIWVASVIVVLSSFVAFKSRHFPDNFGILKEVRQSSMYGGTLVIIGVILGGYAALPQDASTGITYFYIYWFGSQVMQFCSTTLQIYLALQSDDNSYLRRRYLKRREGRPQKKEDEISSGGHSLSPIRGNASIRPTIVDELRTLLDTSRSSIEYKEFEKFLAGEFASENLRMYVECALWSKQYFDNNSATRKSRAKRIVTLFVDVDSVFYVNLPATMRDELVKGVGDDSELDANFFNAAQSEMFNIIEGSYSRFLKISKKPR
jgi:hypothetical protein